MATYIRSNTVDDKNHDFLSNKDNASVPSGFVLKLYQMVNEAPDEIITWLPDGAAFRISNLERLENETLPTFFRHRRFQSLVRQLNFYNFRKVNRERTFWVYRHQLFHRDRPEELHLLRRRTCPGVDGRKQRSDSETTPSRSYSPRPSARRSSFSNDDHSDESVAASSGKKKRKIKSAEGEMKRLKRNSDDKRNYELESDYDEEKSVDSFQLSKSIHERESPSSVMDPALMAHVVPPESEDSEGASTTTKRIVSPNIFGDSVKRERSNSFEQSMLVGRVARKLEEHAKRAAAAKGFHSKKRGGTVTPPYYSDTMKYHALTYDDEIEIYDSARGCVVETQQRTAAVLNDSNESYSVISNDDEDKSKNTDDEKEDILTPPIENSLVVKEVVRKLHGWARQSSLASRVDGQLAAAITGFCMLTNPRHTCFEEKCIELMLACGSLVNEFRHYKTALLPGCFSTSGLTTKNSSRLSQINQLLHTDKKSTLRAFKVFLLNNLEDLVNDNELVGEVGLSVSEAKSLDDCHQIWMHSLRQLN